MALWLKQAALRLQNRFHDSFFALSNLPRLILPLDLNDQTSVSLNPLLEALWLAAPKSKVTRSRKRIRNNHPSKRLVNIVHFQTCHICNEKKLRHRLCMSCYKKGKYFTET